MCKEEYLEISAVERLREYMKLRLKQVYSIAPETAI